MPLITLIKCIIWEIFTFFEIIRLNEREFSIPNFVESFIQNLLKFITVLCKRVKKMLWNGWQISVTNPILIYNQTHPKYS